MSRKTAAQKARAAKAAASTSRTTTTETKRKHQGQDDPLKAKKSKLSHDETSKPLASSESTEKNIVDQVATPAEALRRPPGHTRPPPPSPPASLPSNTIILPPEADDPKLRSHCELHTISMTANSKMESKIQQALQALQSSPSEGKTVLVALTASSRAANKCVGVAEIAKRELGKAGSGKVYQYTGCWTRLETHVPKPRKEEPTDQSDAQVEGEGESDEQAKKTNEDEDDDDDAFESAAVAERKQVRNTTCLVIYLALAPVPGLRDRYGERVHEGDKG